MKHFYDTKRLGVCYYPEHWPQEVWAQDAAEMVSLGISIVRIGEFAWSRLEPSRGTYEFEWLKDAIETLGAAGLKVVLGTPTATPPKWLVDEMPDMLPVGADGKTRNFGSRRHYSYAHDGYRSQCKRIVTELAKAFGSHPVVIAWQIDNEYGCHDTSNSFAPCDLQKFRDWLAQKYQSPHVLNERWGNVFWSMEYSDFNEVEFPNQTVCEANPSHWMDYHRFSSQMIVEFNRLQADIIRKHSPGRDVVHNFMGRTLEFDHFAVGADLDISTWDSYPLGFLEDRSDMSTSFARQFATAGDPDFQAFHHDLYRATSKGRMWVMEQQPGPVNWAPHNPAPRSGMVRLWSLEALAHGAEVVSYFRWRQAPFAQEQMHSGLKRPDNVLDRGGEEALEVAKLIQQTDIGMTGKSEVAILFDYPSAWAWKIQPQGKEFDYFRLVFDFYRGLRRLGFSIDFVSAADPDLSGYRLVFAPGTFSWSEPCLAAMKEFSGEFVIGPRSGSKTEDFTIPENLPPNLPAELLDLKIVRVESLREDSSVDVGMHGSFKFWFEQVEIGRNCRVTQETEDQNPAVVRQSNVSYLCGWPDDQLMTKLIHQFGETAGLATHKLPDGLRIRNCGAYTFIVNYDNVAHDISELVDPTSLLLGSQMLEPSGVAMAKRRV